MTMKEMMKEEAIRRMQVAHLHGKVIYQFRNNDNILLSCGLWLFPLPGEYKQRIKAFEEETQNLVYHVIESNTAIGKMLSLLYVSPYPEEWHGDMEDLECRSPLVYVINLDDEYYSEFGTIGIIDTGGVLVRTF